MFTIDCEDPNCMECKRAAKEKSSEEGNQSKMPKTAEKSSKEKQGKIPETAGQSSEEKSQRKPVETIQREIASNLQLADLARRSCLETSCELKKKIRSEINALIRVLQLREQELCYKVEREYSTQVKEIDNDLTANCVDKVWNRLDKAKFPPPRMVFKSDFDALKVSAACFGKLTYVSNEVNRNGVKEMCETTELNDRQLEKQNEALFTLGEYLDAQCRALIAQPASSTSAVVDAAMPEFDNQTQTSPFFCHPAPKGSEEDSEANVKDKVSEDPQKMSTEERRRRREMHFLKIQQQRQRAVKLGETRWESFVPQKKLFNKDDTWGRGRGRLISPQWSEIFGENNPSGGGFHQTQWRMARKDNPETPASQIGENALSNLRKMTKKDDPETLSNQIKKNMAMAAEIAAARKEMDSAGKRGSLETVDSVPNQKAEKNSSMHDKVKETLAEMARREHSKALAAKKEQDVTKKRVGVARRRCFEIVDLEPKQKAEKNYSVELLHSIEECQRQLDKQRARYENIFLTPTEGIAEDKLSKKELDDLMFKLASHPEGESSESTDSSSSEDAEKDSSLDEDDIEIISVLETKSIPSDFSPSPPLPPKNRFKFGGKPSCFTSLLRKKPDHSPRNGTKSESSGIGESESQKSSLSSLASSGGNAEMKENPSFNEQPLQESSSDGSKDVGPGSDPTLALRASLKKYLEKNPESEWLATSKSSEKSKAKGNCSKKRVKPVPVPELACWLPRGFNQEKECKILSKCHPLECKQKKIPSIFLAESEWLYNARK